MSLRALFVFLIIYAPACAPENGQQAVDSITASILHKHIAILASDEFGGRAPFSEGEKKTLDYLVSEFRRMGLKPGNGDSYLQAVPLSIYHDYLVSCVAHKRRQWTAALFHAGTICGA